MTGHSKRPPTPPLSVSASGLVSPSSRADSGRLGGHCAVASRGACGVEERGVEQAASSPRRRAEPRTTASRGGETGCCCGLSASRVGGSSPAPLERARNELLPSPDAEPLGGVGGNASPPERSGDAAGGTGGGGEAAAFAAGSGGGELIPEAARRYQGPEGSGAMATGRAFKQHNMRSA